MPPWISLALLAAVAIALHYLTLRAASGRLSDALGALLLEGTAALGIAAYLALGSPFSTKVAATRAGIAWSCASGLTISAATTLLFATLRRGGPVSAAGPLILGGGVALSALLAPLLFGDTLTPRRLLGIALGIGAVVVLATERPVM